MNCSEAVLFGAHRENFQDPLEKTIMLEKVEGSRKRGRANTRWTDSLKEVIGASLQGLRRPVGDRTFWRS